MRSRRSPAIGLAQIGAGAFLAFYQFGESNVVVLLPFVAGTALIVLGSIILLPRALDAIGRPEDADD